MNPDARRRGGRAAGRIERALERRAGWWDRAVELPRVWGVLAAVVCTWLLIPPHGLEVPRWRPGEVAERDVVVPRSITLPDESATEALRQEAREQVAPVYDLDPGVEEEAVASVRRLFAACRERLASGGPRPAELAAATGLVLPEGVGRVLRASRCGEGLEAALVEVVRRLYRVGVVDDVRTLQRVGERGITVRNLGSGSERERTLADLAGVIDGRSEIASAVRALLLEHEEVRRSWLKPLTALLGANLGPNLVYNRGETALRRDAAAAQVTERVQVLERGQVLVRRGDRVTPAVARTLALLAHERGGAERWSVAAGIAALVTLTVLGWWWLFRELAVGRERRYRLSAVYLLMMLVVATDRAALFLANAAALSAPGPGPSAVGAYLWAIPHAVGPLAAVLLLGVQPAALLAVFQALAAGILLGGDFTVVPYALAGGLVAVIAGRRAQQSAVLTRVGLVVGLASVVCFLVLFLYRGGQGSPGEVAWSAVFAFVSGPVAAGLAGFGVPLLERVFGITTDLRLLELSNHNLPLLRRLASEAPGTFQHSLAVAHLAEAGAEAVGANALLVRVGAYYHDIGKLLRPEYFVENQRGANPHDQISPSMSALVLMSHVKEGLEMARKARLPLPVRKAIATHHGTKLMRFFYTKAQEEADAAGDGGRRAAVRESDFRYPGPKPDSKELGILLLADAVEAASRTLESPTPSRIQSMIDRIFTDALQDDQLDDTELTFRELEKVGSAFLWVLSNAYHHRVDYPGFDFNRKGGHRDSGALRLAAKTVGTGG